MISPDVQSNVHIWPNDPKVHRRGTKAGLKPSNLQDSGVKISGTPKIWGRNPQNPKAG